VSFSVSVRGKTLKDPIKLFLTDSYPETPISDIDSVFGFLIESTPLYGGRNYYVNPWVTRKRVPELSARDVEALKELKIGLRVPLTSLFVTEKEYENSAPFFERLKTVYSPTALVARDELARAIRRDYPWLKIEASVIRDLRTVSSIERALETYDSVVPAFEAHEDLDLLDKLPRDKTRLFANVSCERACPARICYAYFSRVNKNPRDGVDLGPPCSQSIERLSKATTPTGGMTRYPIERYKEMGFDKFKLLRERVPGQAA